MGDMKTPDFDDLLAAFDIPDMVDPKAAIESGHDDQDGQLKHNVHHHQDEDNQGPTGPDVGVSVIVKNVRNIDPSEQPLSDKDAHPPPVGSGSLQNGFLGTCSSDRRGKSGGKPLKKRTTLEDNNRPQINNPSFNQFSPISSAEEFDEDDKIEVDDPVDSQSNVPSCSLPNPLTGSTGDGASKPGSEGKLVSSKVENDSNGNSSICLDSHPQNSSKTRKPEEQRHEVDQKPSEIKETSEVVSSGVSNASQVKAKSSAKLSSCIAAIAALTAKKASSEPSVSESPTSLPDSSQENKDSPQIMEEPQDQQETSLDVAKKTLSEKPESPCSVTSEGSSKGSPSSPNGSIPVIPKVRIKTIKTSSGQIKRTVSRVLPEFDPEGLRKAGDSFVISGLSPPNSNTAAVFSSPSRAVMATSGGPAMEVTKQMTIKPVATAFLPVSAVKTAGSQVINLKLANNTTVKATVIPAASMQSASSAILKAANAIQQQTVMVPASSLTNAKLKTVHLTNLNLLPQSSSTPSELHQVLSKSQQPIKQAIMSNQTPKKVSRVQVLASSQSSVVEAFNKVLSSINPVPVYVPNLSPPSAACISIPSRGYKCLECGDSFALEKSLTQHYDRRSVRIEVTCNHCTRNLVFYNKCSLLSHARGHKDKGVVMQCSHLILKPIPADQMISPASSCSSAASSPSISSNAASVGTFSSATSSPQGKSNPSIAVISAPSSAPLVAAMPLEEDASRLCRHNLKCLECNEVFQEESALAMHYQQGAESTGQKTCSICQMLLPNPCSFASHQRIHQHKSPYICPECGAICRSVHFQSHVTKNCLHYTRRVGYRCVHCSVIFADVGALKTHIQGSHCEIFYKCPICPMAFKSAPGTHSHAYTQHPGVKIAEPKLIYKCSMCDTVFTQQTLLNTHFDQHLSSHRVSVFKCPDCSMHYAQKQLMMEHIKSLHGTLKTIEGPPNLGINLPLSTKATNSNTMCSNTNKETGYLNGHDKRDKKPASPTKKTSNGTESSNKNAPNPGWTCRDCSRLFAQREVYINHMKREHGMQLKKHPCRLCDKSFSSSHSLCRHNRIKHKGLRKVYSCPHCPESSRTFTKRLMLDKHIQLVHDIKTGEGKPGTAITPTTLNADKHLPQAPSPKRKQHATDNPEHQAARRREGDPEQRENQDQEQPGGAIGGATVTAPPDVDGETLTSEGQQPLKKLKVSVCKVHRCGVCNFSTEDLVEFHQHIPQHRSDGSSFQCRECGLCYTSHPSLARHLFIIHKLKEPASLGRHRAGGGPGGVLQQQQGEDDGGLGGLGGLGDEAGADEEQGSDKCCKVCRRTFETQGALKTHMRTHGMAFIRSKRLGTATDK